MRTGGSPPAPRAVLGPHQGRCRSALGTQGGSGTPINQPLRPLCEAPGQVPPLQVRGESFTNNSGPSILIRLSSCCNPIGGDWVPGVCSRRAWPPPSLPLPPPHTHWLIYGCGQDAQSGEPGALEGREMLAGSRGGSLLHPHHRDRPQSQAPSPSEPAGLDAGRAAFCQDLRLSWWPRGAHRAAPLPAGHHLHSALPGAQPAGPATWPGHPEAARGMSDWRLPVQSRGRGTPTPTSSCTRPPSTMCR